MKKILKNILNKFKVKKINCKKIIEIKDISTRAILVDITDVRKLIKHEDDSDLDKKLYNMFWNKNDLSLMNYIMITMYIEIPAIQIEDIIKVLSKSIMLKHHSVIEENRIRFVLQGTVTAFREYITNSNPLTSENLYKLIVRTLHQTHCVYFTDMIMDGIFNRNEFNRDFNNQACNIIDTCKIPNHDCKLLYFNNVDKLYKLCDLDTRYISSLNYFVIENENRIELYTLNECVNKNLNTEYIKDYIFKNSQFTINDINNTPLYKHEFREDYFDDSIDEIIDENILNDDNDEIDLSETIKSFYNNGGVNIYEETDYKEV